MISTNLSSWNGCLGFIYQTHSYGIFKLNKAFYALEQAHREWFDKFSSFLINFGFICSVVDSSLFFSHSSCGSLILLLYVDEILLTD